MTPARHTSGIDLCTPGVHTRVMPDTTRPAPTDAELLAAVRRAVANGTYILIDPATLADAVLDETGQAPTEDDGVPEHQGDPTRDLWRALFDAHRAAFNLSRPDALTAAAPDGRLGRARSYRNGLLTAYALLTGKDAEGIHEDLQAALIAEHEAQPGDRD